MLYILDTFSFKLLLFNVSSVICKVEKIPQLAVRFVGIFSEYLSSSASHAFSVLELLFVLSKSLFFCI